MKPHTFRPVPFFFGLFFLALAAMWGLWQADLIATVDLRFLAPFAVIVIGALGLVAALASARKETS